MGGMFSLCERIGMPAEAVKNLTDVQGVAKISARLHAAETFEEAANALHEALAPDEDGWKILSVMLNEAAMSEVEYQKRGIPEKIYVDTMAAFSRFVKERFAGFGQYGFDRWWWTGRQISLRLFRIGLLEYELCDTDGKKEVSVHIPSGMPLTDDAVDASLKDAKTFLRTYFPEYAEAPLSCFSWLLTPVLKELLPPTSRILRFAARFELKDVNLEDDGYKFFVFGRSDIPPEQFAEDTSLRRAIKEYVVSGGKIGDAYGVLR